MHHIGVVVDNWENTQKFYMEVMGGKNSSVVFDFRPNIGEFQDDILDAQEHNVSQPDWGIPEIGKWIGSTSTNDLRVEPHLQFT